MELFAPELVIISSGFDAHAQDPLGRCQLLQEDFEWATRAVMKVCDVVERASGGVVPCISVLEGGYNIRQLALCGVAHVHALCEKFVNEVNDDNDDDNGGDDVDGNNDDDNDVDDDAEEEEEEEEEEEDDDDNGDTHDVLAD